MMKVPIRGMLVIALLICALFSCFTATMFADNVKMAIEDTSTIDRKMEKRAKANDKTISAKTEK